MNGTPNWPLGSTLPIISQLDIFSQSKWLQDRLHCHKLQWHWHFLCCYVTFTWLRLGSVGLCWDLLALYLQYHEPRNSPRHPQTSRFSKHWFLGGVCPMLDNTRGLPSCVSSFSCRHCGLTPSELFILCVTPRLPNPVFSPLSVPFQLTCVLFKPGTHGWPSQQCTWNDAWSFFAGPEYPHAPHTASSFAFRAAECYCASVLGSAPLSSCSLTT